MNSLSQTQQYPEHRPYAHTGKHTNTHTHTHTHVRNPVEFGVIEDEIIAVGLT